MANRGLLATEVPPREIGRLNVLKEMQLPWRLSNCYLMAIRLVFKAIATTLSSRSNAIRATAQPGKFPAVSYRAAETKP